MFYLFFQRNHVTSLLQAAVSRGHGTWKDYETLICLNKNEQNICDVDLEFIEVVWAHKAGTYLKM